MQSYLALCCIGTLTIWSEQWASGKSFGPIPRTGRVASSRWAHPIDIGTFSAIPPISHTRRMRHISRICSTRLKGRIVSLEMTDTLVFDFDGVIADTEPLYWRSWAALLAQYDIPFTCEEYCLVWRGISDARMLEAFGERLGPDDGAELLRQNDKRKHMVREWSLAEVSIPQTTIDMLSTLDAYRVGLVTGPEMWSRYSGLRRSLNTSTPWCSGKTSRPQPAPDLICSSRGSWA